MSSANRSIKFTKRITNTGVSASEWVILKQGGANTLSIQVEASATATVSVQATDNIALAIPSDTVPAAEINDIASMTGLVANGKFSVAGPVKAVRINQTAGVGTSAITVLQLEST